MLTVTFIVALAGFIASVVAAMGKGPVWLAALLVSIALLLQLLPIR